MNKGRAMLLTPKYHYTGRKGRTGMDYKEEKKLK
jgi:hypothetical protein